MIPLRFKSAQTKVKSMRKILGLAGAAIMLLQTSCSTDFELNAPYQEISVVYGLLDQTESVHLIKINKSFLGEGNAFQFATIADSSEYASVQATIKEYVNGGATGREWTLMDTTIENKEEGTFYTEGAKAYYFVEPNLDEEAEYRLEAFVSESGNAIESSTFLVGDFNIQSPFSLPQLQVDFANPNSSITDDYPPTTITWTSSPNSRRYEVALTFHYMEYYTDGDSLARTIDWNLGTHKTSGIDGGESLTQLIEGVNFYTVVAQEITSNANVVRRSPRDIDFIFTVAGDDLHTYMEVNEPSSGIVQERPEYTNISNGVGVFSARYKKTLTKSMNKNSIKELCEGSYTGGLLFCSDNIIYQNELWYCP